MSLSTFHAPLTLVTSLERLLELGPVTASNLPAILSQFKAAKQHSRSGSMPTCGLIDSTAEHMRYERSRTFADGICWDVDSAGAAGVHPVTSHREMTSWQALENSARAVGSYA